MRLYLAHELAKYLFMKTQHNLHGTTNGDFSYFTRQQQQTRPQGRHRERQGPRQEQQRPQPLQRALKYDVLKDSLTYHSDHYFCK